MESNSNRRGRLHGKVALITGAAGNLGGEIVRAYLREEATVIFSGRTRSKLEAAREAALADTGVAPTMADVIVIDGADPASARDGIAAIIQRHGKLDIVINNAGTTGPRQPLTKVPLTAQDLAALQAAGSIDTETLAQSARNILGVVWNVMRAAAPHLQEGASVVNVSTIFSRTEYYGRTAYVVPKAALNALSRQMSDELGARGVRVNTLFPGPTRSARIRSVFATMDQLQGAAAGTTADKFLQQMTLERSVEGEARAKTFPLPKDMAHTMVFLGSDESAAFNGHNFEVTHGKKVRQESRSTWVSRPTLRTVDASGQTVIVIAGDQVEDAVAIARMQVEAGADVIVGLSRESGCDEARDLVSAAGLSSRIKVRVCDRMDGASLASALRPWRDGDGEGDEDGAAGSNHERGPITGAIVLPAYGPGRFRGPVLAASDEDMEAFVDEELHATIAIGQVLTRYWIGRTDLVHEPRFVFLTNGSDGEGNAWANCMRSAIEELIRVWRDESEVDRKLGRCRFPEWGNQIIRYDNTEPENLPFAAGQAARLLFTERRIRQVNLYLPISIVEATGARRSMLGFTENLTGLHTAKVALITGGSAGIGGQVARLLALSGAKVVLAARRQSELEAIRDRIVGELADIGYSGAERRVRILPGVDVGDLSTLKPAVAATIAAFGRIDYLINNAGMSGAEEMAVDMPLESWVRTLDANLVSNYALMHEVLPLMKAQGSGYVLNVSSYFGGEKYLAVAYPNRSDYAVSKSGQRALVETMARFLGPEVQINAIAPGPVDGERLKGAGSRPGLFERRGRLILENRRLNAVHEAVVKALRRGARIEMLLDRLADNDTAAIAMDGDAPRELRALATRCHKERSDDCTWGSLLMSEAMGRRLTARLRLGGYFLDSPEWSGRDDTGWLRSLPPDDKPYVPPKQILAEAAKVRGGVLALLHLGNMPTETEVALATVYFLADRAVSGETFMPSGGLSLERSITERELFGSAKRERLEMMRGKTVWLIGEHLVEYLAEAARSFVHQCHVGRIVVLTRTEGGAAAMRGALREVPPDLLDTIVCGDAVEVGIDAALRRHGTPTTIVATPFVPLPLAAVGTVEDGAAAKEKALTDWLSPEAFRAVVQDNLTHLFRIARKASLIDGCQLVLCSPDVPAGSDPQGIGFALANFVKTTLHAFTATLAVENERLVHDVPVNQINLTRRVRSEEPRNDEEHLEEVKRFGRAVLLAGAPLPDAEDSRYRSRIYRGMAITV
ncbi:MAG: SDR family oxidoreductase [Rhodoferax sp.]|nr:SDR family oxidoreductase [Rhodoferax sp.]